MFKKFPSGKINDTKKTIFFFFWELPVITALLLIYDSYMSWSTRFVSLKSFVEFSIFDSVSLECVTIFEEELVNNTAFHS